MKANSLLMILGLSFVLVPIGWAQKPAAKPAKPAKRPACGDLMTQQGMNRCAQDEYEKADAELNRVYQQVMAKLPTDHGQKLKTAQLAWIQFRDAVCDCKAFTFDGGSLQPLTNFTCLSSETQYRIKQLKSLAEDVSR